MFKYSDWSIDATKILSRRELATVLTRRIDQILLDA
jgi:hypothetical protein